MSQHSRLTSCLIWELILTNACNDVGSATAGYETLLDIGFFSAQRFPQWSNIRWSRHPWRLFDSFHLSSRDLLYNSLSCSEMVPALLEDSLISVKLKLSQKIWRLMQVINSIIIISCDIIEENSIMRPPYSSYVRTLFALSLNLANNWRYYSRIRDSLLPSCYLQLFFFLLLSTVLNSIFLITLHLSWREVKCKGLRCPSRKL